MKIEKKDVVKNQVKVQVRSTRSSNFTDKSSEMPEVEKEPSVPVETPCFPRENKEPEQLKQLPQDPLSECAESLKICKYPSTV